MGLNKGQTNNPKGRPLGAKNKVTTDLRSRINDFLNDNWSNLQIEFEKLTPKEKLIFYEKILQYGLPKLRNTQLTNDLEKMTDEQLDYFINEIKI